MSLRDEIADANATEWTDEQWTALQWAIGMGFDLQQSDMLTAIGMDHFVIRAHGETFGSSSITVARGVPMQFIAGKRPNADVIALAKALGMEGVK